MAQPIKSASLHTFDTIVGQDLVKQFITRAVARNQLPKVLLFSGPAGVGKHSLMYAAAKHLVAVEHEKGSAGAQRVYGKIERGSHPDVIVVEPKGASGQIVKEQVDEMQERAAYAPLESRHKVVLIAPMEAMNVVAANNMLKLLEEPPPSLYFFLATEHMHQVLVTIRSRCALLRCPPVDVGLLADWLMRMGRCSRRRAEAAARLSGGRPGLGLELVSGEDEARRKRICDELDFFQKEGYPSVFRVARNLLDNGGGARQSVAMLTIWFRDLLVASLTREGGAIREELLMNRDLSEVIEQQIGKSSARGFAKALERILQPRNQSPQPFVDGDLLLQVLLTDLGIALKEG